jgi:chemotaxis protein methyltransferase CheR
MQTQLDIVGDVNLASDQFAQFAELVDRVCGIHLPDGKRMMLEARLRRRLRALGLASFPEYLDLLDDPLRREAELPRLIEVVTTNKTAFFRERAHFDFLIEEGLDLLAQTGAGQHRPLRAWSAACSTGEEPYTLAMVLAGVPKSSLLRGVEIHASDISDAVLSAAQRGIYSLDVLSEIPEPHCSRWIMRPRDPTLKVVRIAPELRRLVQFHKINLMDSHYNLRGPMDLVFCRNVLIYFDGSRKLDVLRKLTRCLNPGGLLCLGHADNTMGMSLPLRMVRPNIYARI